MTLGRTLACIAATLCFSGANSRATFAQIKPMSDDDAPTGKYACVTEKPDKEFETLVRTFVAAVEHGDRSSAIRSISFPLEFHGAHAYTIRNGVVLRQHWTRIFTPEFVRDLRKADLNDIDCINSMAMVGNGIVWFDNDGAKIINGY